MNSTTPELCRVLAISPHSKGFGFAVFEQQHRLLDWGVKRVRRGEHTRALGKIELLIKVYQPEAFLLEMSETPLRSVKQQSLAMAITDWALVQGITTLTVTRGAVRAHFEPFGASTKHQIAREIVRMVPALAPKLPPARKPWQSEDARMAIFGAVSIALCWYSSWR